MDPVKKEAPIPTAVSPDQTLVDKTGGIPGVDHSGQVDVTRKAVAGNLRIPQNNVTPEAELAEKNLREAQVADVIAKVAGFQEKGNIEEKNFPKSASESNKWKQNLDVISPFDVSEESKIREMPSAEANEVELERQEKMKAK